jgi:hypothetical protein
VPDDKQCASIPCPQFDEVCFDDVRPIGWQGANFPVIEPAPGFLDRDREQQVQNIIEAVQQYAAEIRTRYRYPLDTLICAGLPTDSTIQPVIDEVRTREIDGIIWQDARGC